MASAIRSRRIEEKKTRLDPMNHAIQMGKMGAGEENQRHSLLDSKKSLEHGRCL